MHFGKKQGLENFRLYMVVLTEITQEVPLLFSNLCCTISLKEQVLKGIPFGTESFRFLGNITERFSCPVYDFQFYLQSAQKKCWKDPRLSFRRLVCAVNFYEKYQSFFRPFFPTIFSLCLRRFVPCASKIPHPTPGGNNWAETADNIGAKTGYCMFWCFPAPLGAV